MREFKFKYRLKSKEDGRITTVLAKLFDEMNGTMQFPIELDKWEVLSIDEWTGKKDIEGRPICENDIVDVGENDFALIVWNENECQFVIDYPDEMMNLYPEVKLAGNIYDNPELLER